MNKNFYKQKFRTIPIFLILTLIPIFSIPSWARPGSESPQADQTDSNRSENKEPHQFQTYTLYNGLTLTYERPDWKYIITELPRSAKNTLIQAFDSDTFWPWIAILSSTAVLYKYDEDILLSVQKQGRDLEIGNDDNTKTFVREGGINIVRLPTDTGSFLYFLGDGWTHFTIAGSFMAYGISKNDYRAWNTSYQILHGMALSTFYNQFLKHAAGREAPSNRTEPRGKWRPFPSFRAYNEKTAKYDAMPSGHLMTGSLVLTIINQNYPEYSSVTLPIGVTLLSLLGWQMVNNGVHWASDYPLGIAMGVFYGHYVAKNWKYRSASNSKTTEEAQYNILPIISGGFLGASLSYEF